MRKDFKRLMWLMEMMGKMISNRSPFKFITVEGGEGSGKTTLLEHLQSKLSNSGIDVVRTREPGGTSLGEHIRRWLLSSGEDVTIGAKAELLLFLAARAQHIEEVIQPAILQGKTVLCDRFNDSTVAYQGAARGLGLEWVRSLCSMVCGSVVPDLTLYLDVDPTVGLGRTRRLDKEHAPSGSMDRIEAERIEFHQRVREAFLACAHAEPHRICIINANRPQHEVIDEALKIVNKLYV